MVTKQDFLTDMARTICNHKDVKRVMLIPNAENEQALDHLRHMLKDVDDDKRVTLFTMQPTLGGRFRQELLGYSLTNAMGVKADEFRD